jgi:hypothetical protein
MPKPLKLLLRAAEAIRQRLARPGQTAVASWNRAVDDLTTRLTDLEDCRRAAAKARVRGWHLAAAVHESRAAAQFADVQYSASRLVQQRCQPADPFSFPTIAVIYAELRQLQEEFEEVVVDHQSGVIRATTDRIVLDEIDLGPFRIELHLDQLCGNSGAGSFRCIAMQPNPAASNESTTHPHVQSETLCGGEASLPLSNALKQGRLADAFILVRSVLQTYNADSPYVSLAHWSGSRCDDCDDTTDSEGLYACEGCGNSVCEDCHSSCDSCSRGRCRSCLDRDEIADEDLCGACRTTCGACNRTVDKEQVDSDTGLCPGCLEDHNSNQEQETEDEDAQTPTAGRGDGAAAGDFAGTVPSTTPNPACGSEEATTSTRPVLAASAA